jgi:hypothetical protein
MTMSAESRPESCHRSEPRDAVPSYFTGSAADLEFGWPTTMRFSRQLGQAVRGAAYAESIEGPAERRANPFWFVVIALAISLLAVPALVIWSGV